MDFYKKLKEEKMAEFKYKITLHSGYSYIHKVNASNKLDAWAKVNDHLKSTYANPDDIECYHINNTTYNTMEKKDNSQVVNFDFQGWPEYKHSIKDLIIAFGGVYNEETKKWEIPDAGDLDTCPRLFEDDGMGYGVNEKYIVGIDFDRVSQICNIWHDTKLEYAQVYAEVGINPGYIFKTEDGTEYVVEDVKVDRETYKVSFECSKWNFPAIEEATKKHEKYIPERKIFDPEYIAECIKRENDKCDLKVTTEKYLK